MTCSSAAWRTFLVEPERWCHGKDGAAATCSTCSACSVGGSRLPCVLQMTLSTASESDTLLDAVGTMWAVLKVRWYSKLISLDAVHIN